MQPERDQKHTSLSGHKQLGVYKQPQWGRITPMKTMSSVLEEELLEVPIPKKTPSLFLPCFGIPLNVIPMSFERMDERAPDVSEGLGGRGGLIS